MTMRRLDEGEGSSRYIGSRIPRETSEQLEALIANFPPHPIAGALSHAMIVRAVIEAGIKAIARSEGITLGAEPKPVHTNGVATRKARSKKPAKPARPGDMKAAGHPRSRARAEKRAAARLAAGCTCKSRHVPPCKLYRQPSAT